MDLAARDPIPNPHYDPHGKEKLIMGVGTKLSVIWASKSNPVLSLRYLLSCDFTVNPLNVMLLIFLLQWRWQLNFKINPLGVTNRLVEPFK